MRRRVLTVLGTRPEAIKLAPVVARLRADPELDAHLLVTGQHREIADQVLEAFGLAPDADLDLLRGGQGLGELAGRALEGLAPILRELEPEMLLVQGDTTTTFAACLAAYYEGIPVAHLEAGLRTNDLANPFPEEANRRLTSVLATLHLAPTPWAKANLLAEHVPEPSIVVTGNTIVDALETLLARPFTPRSPDVVRALASDRPLVVVTTHRRENWGEPQQRIARALREAAGRHPDVTFFVSLHPNPIVRNALFPELHDRANVILSEPLEYDEMVHLLQRATFTITDSGGIQEEGCALGVPVLLLRDVTERPEGVLAGVVRVVGTSARAIGDGIDDLLLTPGARKEMAIASGVFGDGRAAVRTHHAIRKSLGFHDAPIDEFASLQLEQAMVTSGRMTQ